MKKIRKGWLYLVVLCCCIIMPKTVFAQETTPVSVHGQLSVKGTHIVDSKGENFALHGISTHGINWDVGEPYVNKEAFQTLRDEWGVNAVRLAMYTTEYNGYCNGGNQTELKNIIHKGVSYATDLGMYAVIDWHVLNDNTPQKFVEQSKTFFAEMSAKYKDYNNIIYEICNEPNGCSWDEIKSYANTIIPIIRANDPDAIIIVGTPQWSQLGYNNEVAENPLTGYTNLVYALHFYCAESAHSENLPGKLDTAIAKGLPVIVSEFGMSEASGAGNIDATSGKKWLDKLDSYGISYFCWSLSNKSESASLLSSSTGKKSGWSDNDLTQAGKWIKQQYLARKETLSEEIKTEEPVKPGNTVKDPSTSASYEIVQGAESSEDGTVICKGGDSSSENVEIPSQITINGETYKVTEIAPRAFYKNKKIKSVVIGATIETIGKQAFAGCTNLKKVTIGKNVTSIGKKAFSGDKKLKKIIVKTKKLTKKSIGAKAFKGISKKAVFKYPKNKKKVYKKFLHR